MANYTYRGTKMTGTSASGLRFPRSGIAIARVGQTYFNTSTGHVYRCADVGSPTKDSKGRITEPAGTPSKARWSYVRTVIVGKPTQAVAALTAPKRDGEGSYVFESEWKVPQSLIDPKNGKRATKLRVRQTISYRVQGTSKRGSIDVYTDLGTGTTSKAINLNSFPRGGKTHNREYFWPHTKRIVTGVSTTVWPKNDKGQYGKSTCTANRRISPPAKPTVAPLELAETGRVSCKITPADRDGYDERRTTRYQMQVYRSADAKPKWVTVHDVTSLSNVELNPYVDVTSWQVVGRFTRVRVRAMSQGLGGNSEWTGWRYHTVGWPATATITGVTLANTSSNTKGTVRLKTNSTAAKPVDWIRLQKLQSTTARTAAQANAETGWDDMGSVDNGMSAGLTFAVSEVRPEVGKRTWLRVKSWHDFEDIFFRYSSPVELAKLYRAEATARDDQCGIVSITPYKNGTGALIVVGWNEDVANTGTEISWADSKTAWHSTNPPQTHTFVGRDAESQDKKWDYTGSTRIEGLDPGQTLYVRARRYREGTSTTYSPYSELMSFTTESAADDKCGIVSVTPGADGTSAVVVVGFTEDAANDGTEISWADASDAWRSTEQPTSFNFEWRDSTPKSSDWGATATVTIRGLEQGRTYYFRARRHKGETFSAYSKLASVTLNVDSAASDSCGIISAAPGDDGTSADIIIGWTEESSFDGTEISWSDNADAWESTEQPSTFEVTWSDKESRSDSWKRTAIVHVDGLDEGTTYYFRARRYSATSFGAYCDPVPATTSVAPGSVVLAAPSFVATGSDVPLSWTFSGGGTQTAWRVLSANDEVVDMGTGQIGSVTIPADRAASIAVDGKVTIRASVTTGGDYVDSDLVEVSIVDRPAFALGELAALTAQPLAIPVECSISTCNVSVSVEAVGTSGQLPGGFGRQLEGECIWSAIVSPEWVEADTGYTADITCPTGLEFWDGAEYRISAIATDRATGLASDAVSGSFSVNWARKAPMPPATVVDESGTVLVQGIELTPQTTTDDTGIITRSCTIKLVAPEGAADGDVYDIYRIAGEDVQLIGEGFPLDIETTDRFAPFGEDVQHYRIATRTPDGATAWDDFEYALEAFVLRFDFGTDLSGSVELPWDMTVSDSYEKDFERRMHMDGSVGGGWNSGALRTGNLSSRIVKISDRDKADAVRNLGRFSGAVFVRTYTGAAYAANVNVDSIDTETAAIVCDFTAEEIDLTSEFMLPPFEVGDGQ